MIIKEISFKSQSSIQDSLPEQAMKILVEIEQILESGPLNLQKLEKLETLGKRIGHMLHLINKGPESKQTEEAYNLFMNTLTELIDQQKSPITPPASEAATLFSAFDALFQGLMLNHIDSRATFGCAKSLQHHLIFQKLDRRVGFPLNNKLTLSL